MRMLSSAPNQQFVNKWLPIGMFISFFLAITVATLYYAPSWGLMDDHGFLNMARTYWQNPSDAKNVTGSFQAAGMFRPMVFVWATIFYKVFEYWPTGFYIFIAAGNMAAMLLWGIVFYRYFGVRPQNRSWTIFFFPLTFFLFLPFWNIFTYLSVQEKFVVFLAPLALILFQKTYLDRNPVDMVVLYVIAVLGMLSKATFIFVPVAMLVYSFLDLIFFKSRWAVSLWHFLICSVSLAYYAFYTITVQLKGEYTSKYKTGLTIGGLLGKVLGATMLVKILIVIGIIGFFTFLAIAVRTKKSEYLFGSLIYCGLVVYLVLLLPWGLQSYLLSAAGPLALGALFPVYAWFNAKGGTVKLSLNIAVALLVLIVFVGNIVPSISRMGDIAQTIGFLSRRQGIPADIYFMPPGYTETAYATGKFTGKTIYYCAEGKITAGLLSPEGKNYVILTDLFPSISLSGVKTQGRIYANGTWEIFELVPQPGHEEKFNIAFKKTWLQKLKVKIRDM